VLLSKRAYFALRRWLRNYGVLALLALGLAVVSPATVVVAWQSMTGKR
jgi:hypothetical protein